MITGQIKNQIDQIGDTFLESAGITNPMTVLEQMTYLLFIKMLDDAQLQREALDNQLNMPHTTDNTICDHTMGSADFIVEAQGGEERAAYGDDLIKRLPERLTKEFGKGHTATNLRYMRMFYQPFPIHHSLSDKLSCTHYRMLTKVSNPQARQYYAKEAIAGKWSVSN